MIQLRVWRDQRTPLGPVLFYPQDTEELYRKNLAEQGLHWPWRDRRVRYLLNSQGFRCPEWDQIDWASSILCFGCSITLGVGLDEDQTWPYYLSQLLGVPTVNLGQGGASVAQIWANSLEIMSSGLVPRAVAYYWPEVSRSPDFDPHTGTLITRGSWNLTESRAGRGQPEDLGQAWAAQPTSKTGQWAHYMVQSLVWTCPRVDWTWGQGIRSVPGLAPRLDLARDQLHPGPESQRAIARAMAARLKI